MRVWCGVCACMWYVSVCVVCMYYVVWGWEWMGEGSLSNSKSKSRNFELYFQSHEMPRAHLISP